MSSFSVDDLLLMTSDDLSNKRGTSDRYYLDLIDIIEAKSTQEPPKKHNHQRKCFAPRPSRVYITPPTRANESMKDFSQRVGISLMVLTTYNPTILEDMTVPQNTCFMTWEYSSHIASCFELVYEDTSIDISHTLLGDHASTIHTAIGNESRIANDCAFVPDNAQRISQTLLDFGTLTLNKTTSYHDLMRYNNSLHIDWDRISKNSRQFQAKFYNSSNNEFDFYYEKHNADTGVCKGFQDNTKIQNGHQGSNRRISCYRNPSGLESQRIFAVVGTTLPTLLRGKKDSIATCEETVVDKDIAAMHPLTMMYDTRTLYIDKCIHTDTDTHGYIYTCDTTVNATVEVGVWTKSETHMCCTLFHSLSSIIIKSL